MNRFDAVRELVKDPSLRVTDIAIKTGYNKGHVSRLRKEAMKNSSDFECPRCGHCCKTDLARVGEVGVWGKALEKEPLYWVYADDTSQERVDEKAKREQEPVITQEAVECMCGLCKLGKREWVGLTADEVYECWLSGDVVAAVEAKLKEKNQ